jgi:peptide/nickel transport system ATP-binding protein
LEIVNLKKHFGQRTGIFDNIFGRNPDPIRAVDGVSIELQKNQVQGVIGESGCGKTTLLKTIAGLHPFTDGEIIYGGEPISEYDSPEWKTYRKNVQIIWQDPYNSLNPKMKVWDTLVEPLEIHNIENKRERVHNVLEQVELHPPSRYLDRYPAGLSGGEKQRVAIARGLILEPEIILADEPVSMLDVSTQAAILKLLQSLIDDYDVSMLYISHDLSTVGYVCDTINVMYLGRIIETGPTENILTDPKHPYTRELINAVPRPNPHSQRNRTQLKGSTPSPEDITMGCRFKDRCPERMEICDVTPDTVSVGTNRTAACHLYYDHEGGDGQ